jgi:hypothetical protein
VSGNLELLFIFATLSTAKSNNYKITGGAGSILTINTYREVFFVGKKIINF